MHELALAASVLDIVLETAAEYRANRVASVRLAVGEMTGAAPEALQFCFESVAEGTIAADAELIIEAVPLTGRCRQCDQQFPVVQYRFVCPECGSTVIDTLSGCELRVDQIEVE